MPGPAAAAEYAQPPGRAESGLARTAGPGARRPSWVGPGIGVSPRLRQSRLPVSESAPGRALAIMIIAARRRRKPSLLS